MTNFQLITLLCNLTKNFFNSKFFSKIRKNIFDPKSWENADFEGKTPEKFFEKGIDIPKISAIIISVKGNLYNNKRRYLK